MKTTKTARTAIEIAIDNVCFASAAISDRISRAEKEMAMFDKPVKKLAFTADPKTFDIGVDGDFMFASAYGFSFDFQSGLVRLLKELYIHNAGELSLESKCVCSNYYCHCFASSLIKVLVEGKFKNGRFKEGLSEMVVGLPNRKEFIIPLKTSVARRGGILTVLVSQKGLVRERN